MFAILWAILAILAAAASIALTIDATTRAGNLRAVTRAIDAEPGRPGIRDGDLAERLAGQLVPGAVTVCAGSRHGAARLIAASVGLVLTFGALLSDSGFTTPIATVTLLVAVYIGVRFGNARRLRADATRVRLRRWRTHADIPLDAVRGIGFVPSREPGRPGGDRVWIALWCDPATVSRLPESLTGTATVGAEIGWVRLDPIESVSTTQLLRLWQFFASRWIVGDENGVAHPSPPELSTLFTTADRLGFDAASGYYSVDGSQVAHVIHRPPASWRRWRARIWRDPASLPHAFEVRDSLLRTRWLLTKPDAAWKAAFYVTDRHGRRVGTLRAVSAASRNYDLCGTDNQVLATLRPGKPRTTVVDTRGKPIAVWDTRTTELFSDAEPTLRPLCLLSPIVARFAGTATAARTGADASETVPLATQPTAPVEPASAEPPTEPLATQPDETTRSTDTEPTPSSTDPDQSRPPTA